MAAKNLPGAYPLNATLKLRAKDVIAINSFIEKAIYNNDLLDYTIPNRQAERSTYQLTCPSGGIIAFLSDLDIAWSRCEDTELTVFGRDVPTKVVIEDVSVSEIASFYRNDPSSDHIQLAQQIADYKSILKGMPTHGMPSIGLLDNRSLMDDIPVVKPVLTSGAQQDIMRQLYEDGNSKDVHFTVIVTGN